MGETDERTEQSRCEGRRAGQIVLKADQRTGKLTEGVVERLLTKSSFHPHGIKVMLTDGQIGRVREIME